MNAAAPEKRDRLMKDKERDVSERIALGMPAQNSSAGGFDTRLYNQSQGMDSGFKGDEAYDVYDKVRVVLCVEARSCVRTPSVSLSNY